MSPRLSVILTQSHAVPGLDDYLYFLRGGSPLTSVEIQARLASAQPGVDYLTLAEIPETSFSCDNVPLAGYYADVDAG